MQIYKNKENCCGCSACFSTCPVNAIIMEADEEGFMHPVVDEKLCIKCGKCKKVCLFNESYEVENRSPIVYAFKIFDEKIREKSASGGAFSAIAQCILNRNGIVYGVEIDENFRVMHSSAKNKEELKKFNGSKYVQSYLGDTFCEIKKRLESGKYVLFSGTPCQVSGLKLYLGKDYENLITVDFICHGVPSPMMWKHFTDKIQKQAEDKVVSITCRDVGSWEKPISKVVLQNGNSYFLSEYLQLFFSDLAIRKSCPNCKFTSTDREGDFTIGDFWGIKNILPDIYDKKGISVIFFNTEKAKKMYDEIGASGELHGVEVSQLIHPQLKHPVRAQRMRKRFWGDYKKHGYDFVVKKYIENLYGRRLKMFVAKCIATAKRMVRSID